MARRCSPRGRGRKPWGPRPGLAAPRLVRAGGGRGWGVAGSSSVRTSNHSTSGLPSPAPSFQTFCRIRVRSVWSVRSSSGVSRGGGSRAESVRSPAEWARPQVRDARAAELVQLLRAAAAEVMPAKGVAVVVVHLHADPAWVPRPWMQCFTFGHPEERCRSQDDRATTGEGGARAPGGATVGAWLLPRARPCG